MPIVICATHPSLRRYPKQTRRACLWIEAVVVCHAIADGFGDLFVLAFILDGDDVQIVGIFSERP